MTILATSKNSFNDAHGALGPDRGSVPYQVIVQGDRAYKIHRVVVHSFLMGDVEDPELYAAEPLLQWQNSEQGQWIMERAVETPEWHRHADVTTFGYKFAIVAKLKDVDYTFYTLKWGSK